MSTLSSPIADVTCGSATTDIDEELAVLAEPMRVLRSRRNRQLPISRLPTEIVFKHFEEEKRGFASDDVPACLALTHVCKDWRTIALQCPALWTSIH